MLIHVFLFSWLLCLCKYMLYIKHKQMCAFSNTVMFQRLRHLGFEPKASSVSHRNVFYWVQLQTSVRGFSSLLLRSNLSQLENKMRMLPDLFVEQTTVKWLPYHLIFAQRVRVWGLLPGPVQPRFNPRPVFVSRCVQGRYYGEGPFTGSIRHPPMIKTTLTHIQSHKPTQPTYSKTHSVQCPYYFHKVMEYAHF